MRSEIDFSKKRIEECKKNIVQNESSFKAQTKGSENLILAKIACWLLAMFVIVLVIICIFEKKIESSSFAQNVFIVFVGIFLGASLLLSVVLATKVNGFGGLVISIIFPLYALIHIFIYLKKAGPSNVSELKANMNQINNQLESEMQQLTEKIKKLESQIAVINAEIDY